MDNSKLEFLDGVEEVLEILDGYRAKCKAHGYSDWAAEKMTVELHAKFLKDM